MVPLLASDCCLPDPALLQPHLSQGPQTLVTALFLCQWTLLASLESRLGVCGTLHAPTPPPSWPGS